MAKNKHGDHHKGCSPESRRSAGLVPALIVLVRDFRYDEIMDVTAFRPSR